MLTRTNCLLPGYCGRSPGDAWSRARYIQDKVPCTLLEDQYSKSDQGLCLHVNSDLTHVRRKSTGTF